MLIAVGIVALAWRIVRMTASVAVTPEQVVVRSRLFHSERSPIADVLVGTVTPDRRSSPRYSVPVTGKNTQREIRTISPCFHSPNSPNRRHSIVAAFSIGLLGLTAVGCSSKEPTKSALDIQALANQTTAFQRDILKDGTVTYSEYEKAILAQRDCVQAAGAKAGNLTKTGNNELTFSYEVIASSKDEVDRINQASEKCLTEYFSEVAKVWAYQQLLSPQDRDKERPEVIQCLRSDGIALDNNANFEEIVSTVHKPENTEKSQRCIQKHAGYFSVAPKQGGQDH